MSLVIGNDTSAALAASHPLDPLTSDEIAAAVRILRQAQGLGPEARFVAIGLNEPAKETVLTFAPGDPLVREVLVVIRDRARRATFEAVVSLATGAVQRWEEMAGVQPQLTFEELMHVDEAVRADAHSVPPAVFVETWQAGWTAGEAELAVLVPATSATD